MDSEKNEIEWAENRKMRWEKKEEIIIKLESLHLEVKDYLKIWKKTGGGTTGYKIGSVIHQIEETKKYFKEKC